MEPEISPAAQRANQIQTSLRNLGILTMVTFLLLVAGGLYFLKVNHDLGEQGRQARTAICVLRHDLQERVTASELFLRTHPDGFDGVSAADIQASINGQRRTITALSGADCDSS